MGSRSKLSVLSPKALPPNRTTRHYILSPTPKISKARRSMDRTPKPKSQTRDHENLLAESDSDALDSRRCPAACAAAASRCPDAADRLGGQPCSSLYSALYVKGGAFEAAFQLAPHGMVLPIAHT